MLVGVNTDEEWRIHFDGLDGYVRVAESDKEVDRRDCSTDLLSDRVTNEGFREISRFKVSQMVGEA